MSKVNINGVWKDLDKAFVNIGGVWKEAEKIFCNIGGVWKEVEGLQKILEYLGTPTSLSGPLRQDHTGANTEDYAIFGLGYCDGGGGVTSSGNAYNSSLTRTDLSAFQIARYFAAGGNVGSYALFAGGMDFSNYWNIVETVNNSLTLSSATNLSLARIRMLSANTGSHLLFAGGYINSNDTTNRVDYYRNDLSRSTTSLSTKTSSAIAGSASINGHAVFASLGSNNLVEAYNTSLSRLTLSPLDAGYANAVGASIGNDYALFLLQSNLDGNKISVYDASLTKLTPLVLPVILSGLTKTYGIGLDNNAIFAMGYDATNDKRNEYAYVFDKRLARSTFNIGDCRIGAATARIKNMALLSAGSTNNSPVTATRLVHVFKE